MRNVVALALFVLASTGACAQAGVPTEFPAAATPLAADQLKARLTDRVYGAKMTDGSNWRFEWKGNGYFFIDTDRGYRDSGKWRAEDGKVCVEMQRSGNSCSDMRQAGDVLYLKRASNGEVVPLQAR